MNTWSYGRSLSLTSWGQMYIYLRLCVLFFRLTTAKPPLYSPAVRQSKRKHSHHQTSTSSSQPHPGPSSILSSDTSVTPWGGLDLYESSFTTISLLPPPPTPPTPQLTTSTPLSGKQNEDREDSAVNCEVPSSFGAIPQDSGGTSGAYTDLYSTLYMPSYPHFYFPICLCRWSWQEVASETESFASSSSGTSFPPASTAHHHQPQFFSELHFLFLWATCAPFSKLPSRTNQKPHVALRYTDRWRVSACMISFFLPFSVGHWTCDSLKCYIVLFVLRFKYQVYTNVSKNHTWVEVLHWKLTLGKVRVTHQYCLNFKEFDI